MNFQVVNLYTCTPFHVRKGTIAHVLFLYTCAQESRFLTSAAYLLKKTETENVNVKRVKMDVKQAERRKRTNTRPCTRNIVGTMENGQEYKEILRVGSRG